MNKRRMKRNNDFGHYEIQVTDKSERKKHYGGDKEQRRLI